MGASSEPKEFAVPVTVPDDDSEKTALPDYVPANEKRVHEEKSDDKFSIPEFELFDIIVGTVILFVIVCTIFSIRCCHYKRNSGDSETETETDTDRSMSSDSS